MTQKIITTEQAQIIADTLIGCSKAQGVGWNDVNPAICILAELPDSPVQLGDHPPGDGPDKKPNGADAKR